MSLKHHVAFSIPTVLGVERIVLSHFGFLGYRLEKESGKSWVFERGSKFAALWRFSVTAYATKLQVSILKETTESVLVSCDFDVWTFGNLTTGGDVAVLEAEARQLESKLRAVSGV